MKVFVAKKYISIYTLFRDEPATAYLIFKSTQRVLRNENFCFKLKIGGNFLRKCNRFICCGSLLSFSIEKGQSTSLLSRKSFDKYLPHILPNQRERKWEILIRISGVLNCFVREWAFFLVIATATCTAHISDGSQKKNLTFSQNVRKGTWSF